jgi:hypothetical protein
VVVEAKPLAARSADACASRHSRLLPDGSEGGVGSAPLPAPAQCMPDWGRKRLRAWLLSEVGGGGIDFVPAHFATPLALVREEVSELRAVRRPDGAAAGAEDDERRARRSNRLRHAITLRDTAQPGSRTKPHFGRGNYGRLRRAAGAERRQHRTADACRLDRRPLRRVRIRSADHHRRNLALDRGRTAGLADARARASRRAGQRHTSKAAIGCDPDTGQVEPVGVPANTCGQALQPASALARSAPTLEEAVQRPVDELLHQLERRSVD